MVVLCGVLLWSFLKRLLTRFRTKIVGLATINKRCGGSTLVYLHAADRILCHGSSLLAAASQWFYPLVSSLPKNRAVSGCSCGSHSDMSHVCLFGLGQAW